MLGYTNTHGIRSCLKFRQGKNIKNGFPWISLLRASILEYHEHAKWTRVKN